jgi:hypothetical protein
MLLHSDSSCETQVSNEMPLVAPSIFGLGLNCQSTHLKAAACET